MLIYNAIDGYCCKVYKTGFLRFWKKKLVAKVKFDEDDKEMCLVTVYDDELGSFSMPIRISYSKIATRAYLAVTAKR